jgi:hypothetical protein
MAKNEVIRAQSGTEASGTLKEWEQEVSFPENLDEAIEMWGEDTLVAKACRSYRIDKQAEMRRPAGAGGKKAKETYDKLQPYVASGAMTEEQVRSVSGYNPDSE